MGQGNNTTGRKKWKQLSEAERYKIEALSRKGLTPSEIGAELGRDRRTIDREIARGLVVQNIDWELKAVYCADFGQRVCEDRASNKGRGLKIGHDHALVRHIEQKIGKEKYSPDAVIGEIRANKLQFKESICTKTLYNYIDRGLFLNISNRDLPVKKDKKKRPYRSIRKVALNNLKGRSIEERPETVENREEYGNWEMDTVVGNGKACLLVLTERKTRQELIFKLSAKTQEQVNITLDRLERRHKSKFKEIFKSITMDNGSEFLDMETLERSCLHPGKRRTVCYYAHPYSAWERGSNENANKFIRRFIPKGCDVGKLKQADIKRIERWINDYPRRIFGYKSANQLLAA